MVEFLENRNWDVEFGDKSVEGCYQEFLRVYEMVCDIFIPNKAVSGKGGTSPKWMTPEIKQLIRRKLHLLYYSQTYF